MEADMVAALHSNDTRVVDRIMRRGFRVDGPCGRYASALHGAVEIASVKMAKHLCVRHRANPNICYGVCPIHVAAVQCDPVMIETLIWLGAYRHVVTVDGDTPLHLLCTRGILNEASLDHARVRGCALLLLPGALETLPYNDRYETAADSLRFIAVCGDRRDASILMSIANTIEYAGSVRYVSKRM